MLAFDAPSREECAAERPRSNIPQQALVLLNDPVFVEAARVFAEKILKSDQASDEDKISFAFQNALTREPSDDEIKVIQNLLKNQRQRYKEDNKSAMDLLKTGISKYDPSIEVSELAAWTSISRTILNMYETTARL